MIRKKMYTHTSIYIYIQIYSYVYAYNIYKDIHNLKDKIHKIEDLKIHKSEIDNLERRITIFHAEHPATHLTE